MEHFMIPPEMSLLVGGHKIRRLNLFTIFFQLIFSVKANMRRDNKAVWKLTEADKFSVRSSNMCNINTKHLFK